MMNEEKSEKVLIRIEDEVNLLTEIFTNLGVPEEDARIEAKILSDADLRGVDTHGVLLVPRYVKKFKNKLYNPRPNRKIIKETETTLVLDADNGLGHLTATWAMNLCNEKAKQHGVASVTLKNTNHTGAMAYYAEMATKQDLIGFSVTDTAANLAPWGGTKAMLGNNPFSVGIPADIHYPIVLDMAISTVAKGKVIKAAAAGEKIPEGWVTDPKGNPLIDPELIVGSMEKRVPFLLTPIGGVKGSGILIVTTILAGILSSTENFGPNLPNFGSQFEKIQHLGCFFLALDPSRFLQIKEFKRKVDEFIDELKTCKLAEWAEQIYMPGEMEFIQREKRLIEGIPMLHSVWNELLQILEDLKKG